MISEIVQETIATCSFPRVCMFDVTYKDAHTRQHLFSSFQCFPEGHLLAYYMNDVRVFSSLCILGDDCRDPKSFNDDSLALLPPFSFKDLPSYAVLCVEIDVKTFYMCTCGFNGLRSLSFRC